MFLFPSKEECDRIWADLQIGLTDIFDGRIMKPARGALHHFTRLMQLYQHVFEICTTGGGEQLYEKLKQLITDNVSRIFKECENMDGLGLLLIYDENWKSFLISSKLVDSICNHFNRHYIKFEQDKGNENVCSIDKLCFVIWKDVYYSSGTEIRVTNAILDLIHQARTRSKINCDIIKDVLQSYVELNIRDDVYVEWFENKFLQTTADYYRAEARKIEALPRVEYLNSVDKWIIDEAARCAHYLDPTTEPKLCQNEKSWKMF